MVGAKDAIRLCLEEPEKVVESQQESSRYVYIGAPPDFDHDYCITVVDRSSGEIVTAYGTDSHDF